MAPGATTPKRKKSRGSRSLCSPALSTASGRLTSLIDQFKDKNMESFALSPLNRRSILNDDTAIEEPRRKSWWKNLKEDSQQIMEVLEENKVTDANNGIEELIDIEVLSQEKKEYTLDLPESSDNESINSIVLPQRKLFTQKDSKPQKKFGQFSDNRETLAKLHKTNTNVDKTVNVGTRELFQNAKRSKPIFPSALLNISPNKTTADKTKENILPEPKVRNIFGNRPTNKRKNMFADFVVSESEDEIPEIQPRVFGFQKKLEQRRISSISKGREGSPASSITTDMEMDDWKLLPSSTMVENQLEDIVAGHTPKRARLSKLSEAGTNTEAGINTLQTNTTGDKTKASNKSVTSKNKSKSSPDVKDKSLNSSRTTRSMMKNTSKLEEKIDASKQNTKINQSQDKISSKDNELDDKSSKVENKQNTSLNKSQRLNKSRTRNSSKIIEEEKEGDENADNDKNPINNVTRVINKNGSNATLAIKSINEKERTITLKVHDKAKTDANKSKSNKSIHNEPKQAKIVEESVESTNEQSANDNVDGNEILNTEIDENYEHQDADTVSHELNEQQNNSEGEKKLTENIEDEENEEEMNVSQGNDNETNENDNTDEVVLSKVDEENESEINEENVDVNQSNENEEPNESKVEAEVDGSQEIDEQNESQENENEANESQEIENEANESQEMNEEVDDSKIEENTLEDENNESEEESQEVQNDEEEDDVDESQEVDDAEDNDESQELENQEVSQGEHEVSQEEHEVSQEVEQDVENDEESQEMENDEEENEQSQEIEDDEEEENEESQEVDNEEDNQVESEAEVNESEEIEDDKAMDNSDEADKAIASDPEISDRDDNDAEEMEFDDDDNNEQESENEEAEGNEEESHEEQQEPSAEEIEESPNSPEAILHDKTNQMDSFTAKGRNTSIRKTKSMIKNLNIRPSLAPQRDSLAFSDGTRDSSAEGSGWDSHRTTRKTLRQTFGKDFTPRKSLRALVMEKSAKRQTEHQDLHSDTVKYPQANSTELPEYSNGHVEDFVESDHEVSRRTRQTTLETYLQKIKQQNIENKVKMEQLVRNSLKAPSRDTLSLFKVPNKPAPRRLKLSQNKPRTQIKSIMAFGELPTEVIEDMKYKPPKRFQPTNASWITKRLYKFLETKLEPKYDYKARVRAEKLVETIYHFAKDLRRHNVAPTDAVDVLKHELARLEVVQTHFDFYEFFHEFMPREIRVKVVPDIVNKIPLPRHGVFSDILRGNNVQG
ncbi:hypothetical protein HW555_010049 [Spodoptera exigua]|uniref:Uncharacterized protein n=1 Tax=Spodoptera exigua TaxID=7107 RepID=A0A835GBX0_SPOEX|nr:hypothetical protein HW555_010049 [Spodoptera exigua]